MYRATCSIYCRTSSSGLNSFNTALVYPAANLKNLKMVTSVEAYLWWHRWKNLTTQSKFEWSRLLDNLFDRSFKSFSHSSMQDRPISYCDRRTWSRSSVFRSLIKRNADSGRPDLWLATMRNLRMVVSMGCKVESNTLNVSFRIGRKRR